mgnify:CR=1 FL=1
MFGLLETSGLVVLLTLTFLRPADIICTLSVSAQGLCDGNVLCLVMILILITSL